MTNEKENKECQVLTCAQAAYELNTTTQTIREWILLGKIDPKGCFQIGNRYQNHLCAVAPKLN